MTAAIRTCGWSDCLRPAASALARYCRFHRPLCAIDGCPKHAEDRHRLCHAHRRGRPGRGKQRIPHTRQPAECAVLEDGAECGRPTVARSLCWRHYRRLRRRGTVEPWDRSLGACTYDANPASRNGPDGRPLCVMHYWRVRRWGDPFHRRVYLNVGRVCANGDGRPAKSRGLCSRCYLVLYRSERANLAEPANNT